MDIGYADYFLRQVAISEIGPAGQEKLREGRVVIVGVGGVGSVAADYLARSGVGNLRLVDQDIVEPSNLHRISAVGREFLYRPKAEAVAESLSRLQPWVKVEPIVDTLRPSSVDDSLQENDVIVDGLDNFRTRHIVNKFAYETATPYVFGSAIAHQGHVGVFNPPKTPCLECLIPQTGEESWDNCETVGIAPTTVGAVGALVATEAVKLILDRDVALKGRFLTLDLAGPEFLVTNIQKREACTTCGSGVRIDESLSGSMSMLCGQRSAVALPESSLDLDLRALSVGISTKHLLSVSDSALVYRSGSFIVSVFRNGRVLVDGIEDETDVLRVAKAIWRKEQSKVLSLKT